MAMWYQPRQLAGGPNAGKWHYTAGSDEGGGTYAVGACANGCAGHATADEATRHYVEGIAQGEVKEADNPAQQQKCVECDQWTQHHAMFWHDDFPREVYVCSKHDVRAVLRRELFRRYDLSP